jgi:hypothetical protein
MTEHITNTLVGVTHVWPYSKLVNPEAQPFSSEREADVWDELRDLTFDEDMRGEICVALHATVNHDAFASDFAEELQQDDVVNNRVSFYVPREVEFNIHRPATEAWSYQRLRSVAEAYKQGPNGLEEVPDTSDPIMVPAEPAHDEVEKRTIPFHLGSKLDAEEAIRQHRNHEICALVLWHPDESQLKYLPMVHSRCPDLPVYIFHYEYRGDKYGVEREGAHAGSLWDTQSEMADDKELQAVIEHIANQGESTWIFAPPKHGKTWVMLCIVKALLTGQPLFNVPGLRVSHPSKRVIYLCPEASRTSLRKRLKMLGLMEHLYDGNTNPEGRLYLRSLSKGPKLNLDDPELLKLVEGADIFIDTAIRYLEGNENDAGDVKQMTEKILNMLAVGARSMWVAHHSGKQFASATEMTLENCSRGSTEFTAALTNAIGMCQLDKDKNLIHFHFIDGRDMDEPATDMHLQGRPFLSQLGNFQVTENVERFKGRNPLKGRPADPDRQAKIDFAKSVDGSLQDKADAVNAKFGSKHDRSTMSKWLKESTFDEDQASMTSGKP